MEHPSDNPPSSGHIGAPSTNITNKGSRALGTPPGFGAYRQSNDANIFSSSLPLLPLEKLNLKDLNLGVRSIDDASNLSDFVKNMEGNSLIENLDLDGIGSLLPDEDDLLAGMMSDFDLSGTPSQLEELEDCDLFGSGGGMELDFDPTESITNGLARTNISDYVGNGVSSTFQYSTSNGVGTVAGEHPYGEHPSRTLFVRNINSNVEDSELQSLFEQYGDIRTLYTACKHRGFVMISYYDIRAARNAMRALQNKALRRRKLDIHFSIPKDNPSEKDVNQGTLVVFNLDPSVSNDDIRQIFGAYGEIKEIRETPHKRHHKFIEYYDVRAAEAALRALNKSEIAGKRIKLEPSRPGGARRNLMQQLSQELEPDDSKSYRHQVGSPILNSPPGAWAHFGSPTDSSSVRAYSQSLNFSAASSLPSNYLSGLASILTPRTANTMKIAPIGKEHSKVNNADQVFSDHSTNGLPFPSSRSFPEHNNGQGMVPNMSSSSGTSFGHSTPGGSDIETLSGNQFLWGSPNPYPEHSQSSAWPRSPMGNSFVSNGHGQGIPYSSRHAAFVPSSHNHVGSAPSGMPFERHFGYFPDSSESSFVNSNALGSMTSFGRNEGRLSTNLGTRGSLNSGATVDRYSDNGSAGIRMVTSQGLGNTFLGTTTFPALTGFEGLTERGRSRRVDNNGFDNSKQQYQLDLEKIIGGEDTRTTLMIKNIPNKYTSKMLLAAIDEKHTGSYDFLYLPIDFKNKCNVGYAFINMVSPSHVVSFYQVFNGKKWEKFNSEKVASLAYARIQGLDALIAHFQNSSLMNEDKRCRPIIFHTEGSEATDQEPSPPNGTIIRVHQQQHGSSAMASQDVPKSGLLGNGFWSGLAMTRD